MRQWQGPNPAAQDRGSSLGLRTVAIERLEADPVSEMPRTLVDGELGECLAIRRADKPRLACARWRTSGVRVRRVEGIHETAGRDRTPRLKTEALPGLCERVKRLEPDPFSRNATNPS